MEDEASPPSVTHIRGALIGSGDRRITHGAHLVLSGARLDGRTQRALRLRCARVARDKGFERLEDAPAVMQGEIEGYCRVWLATDLMWASFMASFLATGRGQLPDAFLDYRNAMHRAAVHLGLKRELRDAKAIDLGTYVREKYGRNGEGRATPATPPEAPSSASERPAESVRAAQEAREP